MIINPSIGNISEAFSRLVDKRSWKPEEIEGFLSSFFGLLKDPVAFREENLVSRITELVMQGRRDVYIFDEMGKMSEMVYIRSQAPLMRPLVDLCCGYGYWISKVVRHIDLGIDLFPDHGRFQRGIEGIRERNFIDDTYLSVLRGDVTEKIPLPDKSVGTVTAICALEHIPDYRAAIKEIRRVLKPDGRLIVTVDAPLITEVLEEVFNPDYCRRFKEEHQMQTLLSLPQWEESLNEAGLALVDATGYIDRMKTYLYLMTFYPNDFDSYWTRLGVAKLFRETPSVRSVWENSILPCLLAPTDPEESMLICMTAKPMDE